MNMRIFLFILLLFSGAILGHYMLQGSGYILISFQQWVIETSLWVFVLILSALVLSIYGSIHLIIAMIATPTSIKGWSEKRFEDSFIWPKGILKTVRNHSWQAHTVMGK